MTAAELARELREYNQWRRGEGRYAEVGVPLEMSPKRLGEIIDEAAEVLEGVAQGVGLEGVTADLSEPWFPQEAEA